MSTSCAPDLLNPATCPIPPTSITVTSGFGFSMISQIVSLLPFLPYMVYSPCSNQKDLLKNINQSPPCSHLEQNPSILSKPSMTRTLLLPPLCPSPLPYPSTPLQPQWSPCCSNNMPSSFPPKKFASAAPLPSAFQRYVLACFLK